MDVQNVNYVESGITIDIFSIFTAFALQDGRIVKVHQQHEVFFLIFFFKGTFSQRVSHHTHAGRATALVHFLLGDVSCAYV